MKRMDERNSDAVGAGKAFPAAGGAGRQRGGGFFAKLLKIVVPVAVSVGLCVVMFREIDFAEMMEVIRTNCDFSRIALMLLIGLAPVAFRALRWGIQLRALGIKVPPAILFYAVFGTYSVNLVFPRLGEVWRTGYVAVRQNARFSEVFGSMVADRLADLAVVALLTLLTFFVASAPLTAFVSEYPAVYNFLTAMITSPWLYLGAIAAAAGLALLLKRARGGVMLKIKQFLLGLWEGFSGIARMKGKGEWLGLTFLLWGCYYLQLAVAFTAFPMTREMLADHGALVVLVCFVLTSISMGVPSTGGIGPYQATLLCGMTMFVPAGMSRHEFLTQGVAFGNIIIASQTLLLIAGGIVVFILIGIDNRRQKLKRSAGEGSLIDKTYRQWQKR